MKNILYIGPYKENNGLGKSSKRMVECLSENQDINLSIRPIYLTKASKDSSIFSDRYVEYESNKSNYYDAVIQHGYPMMFQYQSRFGKNIGIPEIETSNIGHTGWIDRMNLMDEIIFFSQVSAISSIDSGYEKAVKIVNEPYDLKKYQSPKADFFTYSDKPYIFYTIGEYSEKKNIKSIILAFLLEFNKAENVQLFIKTHDYSIPDQQLRSLIEYDISQIKKSIRKNDEEYCDIDILCGYLKDIDIIRLHKSADAYVNSVKADSSGYCAIEAAICNKQVINTKHIGSSYYFNEFNANMVEAFETNVFSSHYYDKNSFTIYEKWHEPYIQSIRKSLREAYENRTKKMHPSDLDKFDKTEVVKNIL